MDVYEFSQRDKVNENAPGDEESDVDYTDTIQENHLLLVTHLQLDRYFLFSYLRSKGILDEEDVELVTNTGTTRQQRVSRFLDMIKRKGKDGMQHFVSALQYENPALYEKLTGKKADPSVPTGNFNSEMEGLHGKEMNHIDIGFLAKQLAQTTQEMQCLAQVHQKVIEERNVLEKKLMQANKSLQLKDEEIDLCKKMNDTISKMQPMGVNHGMMESRCSQVLNEQEYKIIQKDHLVTVLQGKLLELMEEMEGLRKANQELTMKNNIYSRDNVELQFRYNSEKRQSVLLKERVKNQEFDKNYMDKFKTDIKQNITDMISLREENIVLKKEVEEFRKYGEVLNTRFKLVVQEKHVISEKQRGLSDSNFYAQEQATLLMNANSILQLEKEHLQITNKRLIGDISISMELQNSLQNEWKKVREECDKLYKSLEEAKAQKDLAEEVSKSHILISTELNKKYIDVCKELDDMRLSFQQSNEEILKYKSDIEKLKDGQTSEIEIGLLNDIIDETNLDRTDDKVLEYLDIEGINYVSKRSNRQVLNSIKRNITEKNAKKISLFPQSMSFQQISLLHTSNTCYGKSSTLPNLGGPSISTYFNDFDSSNTYGFRSKNGTELSDSSSNEEKDLLENVFVHGSEENSMDINNEECSFRPRGTLYDNSKGKPCIRHASVD